DDGQIIRGVNWRQVFPFTHVFRSFRVAVHPSKLLLGLALLLVVYAGGRLLDSFWPARSRALPGEVGRYEDVAYGRAGAQLGGPGAPASFADARERGRKGIEDDYAQELIDRKVITPYKDHDAAAEAKARADASPAAKSGHKLR